MTYVDIGRQRVRGDVTVGREEGEVDDPFVSDVVGVSVWVTRTGSFHPPSPLSPVLPPRNSRRPSYGPKDRNTIFLSFLHLTGGNESPERGRLTPPGPVGAREGVTVLVFVSSTVS